MQIAEIFHEPVTQQTLLGAAGSTRWGGTELRKQQGLLPPVLYSLARQFLGYFFFFFSSGKHQLTGNITKLLSSFYLFLFFFFFPGVFQSATVKTVSKLLPSDTLNTYFTVYLKPFFLFLSK